MTQSDEASIVSKALPENLLVAVRDLVDSDPRAALEQAEMLLPTAPDPRLFRLAAEACRRLGMIADAEDAELAGIQAGFRSPELNSAAIANQDGRNDESRAIIDRVL